MPYMLTARNANRTFDVEVVGRTGTILPDLVGLTVLNGNRDHDLFWINGQAFSFACSDPVFAGLKHAGVTDLSSRRVRRSDLEVN